MTTPKRSNRTVQQSMQDQKMETKMAAKGGKWWWKKLNEKPTKASVTVKGDNAKPESKGCGSKETNTSRRVHIQGSTNGSVEVVCHNKAKQTMERTLAKQTTTTTMATSDTRPMRENSNNAPETKATAAIVSRPPKLTGGAASKEENAKGRNNASIDKHIHYLEEQIDQLDRKLEVYKKQNENQTKEITTLRTEHAMLHAKLGETKAAMDWLEPELDTTRRQLIGMSIAKKKVDRKLAMELERTEQVELADKSVDESSVGDKENAKPLRATKLSRMKTKKQFLAKKHQKTARILAAKSL